MATDTYTEVTRTSWGSRIGSAFGGIVVGAVMFLAAFPVLFLNEGRAVNTAAALDEGAGAVLSVAAAQPDPANDGRLVHLTGRADSGQRLVDDAFGVEVAGLLLRRRVQMYQWTERKESTTKKEVGGGTRTTTTYHYRTEWRPGVVDSMRFKRPDGHRNPDGARFAGREYTDRQLVAENVTVGGFRLSPEQVARIGGESTLALEQSLVAGLPPEHRRAARIGGGHLYLGSGEASPRVGDLRIRWDVLEPTEVSIVAAQRGDRLVSYAASNGRGIHLIERGTKGADQMFESARAANDTWTWGLRLAGLVLMGLGITLVLRPLSVLADVIPILGNLAQAGSAVVALLVTLPLGLGTIAVAWLAYRPLLAGALALVAVASTAAVVVASRRRRAARGDPARDAPDIAGVHDASSAAAAHDAPDTAAAHNAPDTAAAHNAPDTAAAHDAPGTAAAHDAPGTAAAHDAPDTAAAQDAPDTAAAHDASSAAGGPFAGLPPLPKRAPAADATPDVPAATAPDASSAAGDPFAGLPPLPKRAPAADATPDVPAAAATPDASSTAGDPFAGLPPLPKRAPAADAGRARAAPPTRPGSGSGSGAATRTVARQPPAPAAPPARLLTAAMVAAIKAGGDTHDRQKRALVHQARKAGWGAEWPARVRRLLASPPGADTLAVACRSARDREAVYAASLLVSDDGDPRAAAYLDTLATALGLSPERVAHVRAGMR